MNTLEIKQQTTDSWTAKHAKTGVLVAWITQLQNKLGDSNESYQVVIRGDMTQEFTVFNNLHSLDEVTAFLDYKLEGEA